jgi:hypothetical protein
MPLTTGLITNTRDFGTAATNVVVNLVNENISGGASVEVRIFYVLVPDVKIPLYVSGITLAANSIARRVFFVSGVFAYEVQFAITEPVAGEVVVSTFGLDAFGNLVQEQGILHQEMHTITNLTPTVL